MSQKLPFHANGATVTVSATTVGTTVHAIAIDGSAAQVQVTNSSTLCNLINFGSSTVTAVFPSTVADVSGYVIPPSATVTLTPGKATYAAAASSAGTNLLYATPGTGGS